MIVGIKLPEKGDKGTELDLPIRAHQAPAIARPRKAPLHRKVDQSQYLLRLKKEGRHHISDLKSDKDLDINTKLHGCLATEHSGG